MPAQKRSADWAVGIILKMTRAELPPLFRLSKMQPHFIKIKGDRIRQTECAADHACEIEAKDVFLRKRAVIQARYIGLVDFAEHNRLDGVRHNRQGATTACAGFLLVVLQ